MAESSLARLWRRLEAPALLLLAIVPRLFDPISRPEQWYMRAIHFMDALAQGNWAETYQRYHPGVTTMWLAGIGIKLYGRFNHLSSEQLLWMEPVKPGVRYEAMTAGVIPLVLFTALGILLAYLLLRKLAGRRIALAAGVFLALDPFLLANSRALHLDAPQAMLMLLSALLLLRSQQVVQGRIAFLGASGVCAGLALLTKSSAVFLIPYALLVVGVCNWTGSDLWGWLWGVVRRVGFWLLCAAVIFVIVWPAMWVEPGYAVGQIFEQIVSHVDAAHYNPVFFNGVTSTDDPGLGFYLATVAWKTTWLSLPAALLAGVSVWFGARGRAANWQVKLLVAFVVFFTVQMGLSARKAVRYLLPVFPVLDVLAAIGLVQAVEWLGRHAKQPKRKVLERWLLAVAFLGQGAAALVFFPYYGVHHNRLLGGSEIAQHILPLQDQGEGLDLAAEFLNQMPEMQHAQVGLHKRNAPLFWTHYDGVSTDIDDPTADYRIYYVNQIVRGLNSDTWEAQWEVDRQSEPLWKVAFDGVEYVWVYGQPPEAPAAGGPEVELDVGLGEHIRLTGVRTSREGLVPGELLTVVLNWTSDGEVDGDYKVFCHLVDEQGELVAQQDGKPMAGGRPTNTWRDDELIEDDYVIDVPQDMPPGRYRLLVGMYDFETMGRLPAGDTTNQPFADNRIQVAEYTLDEE